MKKTIIVLTATALILISSFNSAFGQLGRLSKKKRQTDTTVISNPNVENPNSEKEPIVARSKSQVEIINDRLLELEKKQSDQDIKYDKLNNAFVKLKKEVKKGSKSMLDSIREARQQIALTKIDSKSQIEKTYNIIMGKIRANTMSVDSLLTKLEARADTGDIESAELRDEIYMYRSKTNTFIVVIISLLVVFIGFLAWFILKKRQSMKKTADRLRDEADPNHVNYRRAQKEYQTVD